MAWVVLTKEERVRVRSQLPDILSVQTKASLLIPDLIAFHFYHDTSFFNSIKRNHVNERSVAEIFSATLLCTKWGKD